MERLKCVAEEGGTFLPKNLPQENTGFLEKQKKSNVRFNSFKYACAKH